jgi:hypothetical protein
MGQYVPEPLRHPVMGCLMPWADARPVPSGTLLAYLGEVHYAALDRYTARGCFAEAGCVTGTGREMRYVPAAIWRANRWLPDPALLAVMANADRIWGDINAKVELAARLPHLRVVGG